MLVDLGYELPTNHSRLYMADGEETAKTISEMQKLVTAGKRDYRLREFIGPLIQKCKKKDYHCYADALFRFCRDEVQYVFDPNGVELIEHPWRIIETRIADCDSVCVLVASLFESIGFPCRFVTVKADPKRPTENSHVFVEVNLPKEGWLGADATMPFDFGWRPNPKQFPRSTWAASLDEGESHDPGVMGMDGMENCCGPLLGLAEMGCGSCVAPIAGMGEFVTDPNLFAPANELENSGLYTALRPFDAQIVVAPPKIPPQPNAFALRTPPPMQPMKGMGAFGALSTGEAQLWVSKFVSGEMRDELASQKRRADENLSFTYQAKEKAAQLPNPMSPVRIQMLAITGNAYQKCLEAKQALQQTINSYSEVVRAIETASGGYYKPGQLAGLGFEPMTIGILAAAVIVPLSLFVGYKLNSDSKGANAVAATKSVGDAAFAFGNSAQTMKEAGVSAPVVEKVLLNMSEAAKSAAAGSGGSGISDSIGTVVLLGIAGFAIYAVAKKKGYV